MIDETGLPLAQLTVDLVHHHVDRRIHLRGRGLSPIPTPVEDAYHFRAMTKFFDGDNDLHLLQIEAKAVQPLQLLLDVVTARGDIERLKTLVVFINIWLAPLLIAAAGVFLFWRRQRRGRVRA